MRARPARPARLPRPVHRPVASLRPVHRNLLPFLTLCSCLVLLGAALGLAACGGGAEDLEGAQLFRQDCALCHGPEGRGKSGVASSLVGHATVQELSDEELTQLIAEGLPSSDPRNDSGVPMPPKGGNPDLTEEQIGRIVAYLRQLQP